MTDVNLKIRHAKRQNAQNLDLKELNLETIPADVFSLKTLLYLNLSNNKLSTIDKSIENLKNLTELNLSNNALTTLPIELTTLPNLKVVKIENNPISEKLEDFNYNWKESLKNYINGNTSSNINNTITNGISNSNSKIDMTNINEIKKGQDINTNTSTETNENTSSKKPTFNLTSSKMSFNNTLGNFNMKNVIKEIPKCNLFDNRDSVKFLNNPNNNISNTRIRIQSGNPSKRITPLTEVNANPLPNLNKNESTPVIFNKIDENIRTYDKAELDLMKQKVESLEKEIKNLQTSNTEKEDEYKNAIRLLQAELKSLKSKGETIENVITNKRNWMNDTSTVVNPNTNAIKLPVFNEESDNKVKDLESQLQKETQNSKRLKNEIERLSQQLNSVKSINTNSEDIQKSILEINYDDIKVGNKIGQGGFSIIYNGIWNYLPVAVKVIFDPNVTEDLLNEFNNEIMMLFNLRHPNIVLLIGISSKPQKLAIISEFIESGSLFELLHRTNKELSLPSKIKIIVQLLRAFSYIHNNGIVHRDVKSHNVLVDEYFNVKLCDFGLAKKVTELNFGSGKFCGTPTYMSPELFMKKAYDEKIDVFSFGTLLWEILVRKVPYEGLEIHEIKNKILTDEKLFVPKTVPLEFTNVIESCRLMDASKRPSFNDLLKLNCFNK